MPFNDATLFNKLRSLLEKNASKHELSTTIGYISPEMMENPFWTRFDPLYFGGFKPSELQNGVIIGPFKNGPLWKLVKIIDKQHYRRIGFDQKTVSGFSARLLARDVEFQYQLDVDYNNLRALSQVQEDGVIVEDAAEYPACPW